MHTNSGNATLLKLSHSQDAVPHLQPEATGLARIKVVMLGAPGVGKTALMQQFLGTAPMCCLTMQKAVDTEALSCPAKGSMFEPSPTVGVDFATRTVSKTDGNLLRLHLWDTSGQQRFRYMVDGYLRDLQDHDAVVVVYDVSDLESFKEVDECIGRVCRLASGCPRLALVGMKADIQDRAVTFEVGKGKADEYGIPVFTEASTAEIFGKQGNTTLLTHSIEQDLIRPLVHQCCKAAGQDMPMQNQSPQPRAVPVDNNVKTQPSNGCDYDLKWEIKVLQSLQRCWKPMQRCSKPLLTCLRLL